MKKRISAVCAGLMLCAAMFTGCSQTSAEEGVPSFDTPSGVKVQNISASWHKSYNSIEALAADSDLIALVEITDEERVEQHESLYFTISTANVLETVYSTEDVETVEIYQTGRRTDTELIQIAEDPLMNEGENGSFLPAEMKTAHTPFWVPSAVLPTAGRGSPSPGSRISLCRGV